MIGKIIAWYGFCGVSVRSFLYSLALGKSGRNLRIKKGVVIDCPEMISVGDDFNVGEYSFLSGNGGIRAGSGVIIGHHVSIITSRHGTDRGSPMWKQKLALGPVEIGDDVWIGAGARILPNTKIGNGAVVGANAVVTHDVEPYTGVAGVPAKKIGDR